MPDNCLAVFDSLPKAERTAFIAWFAGGRSFVIKYANRDHVSFGKTECEWVPFSFWLDKLPDLGWITITEVRRYIAKGAIGTPEAVEYRIDATDAGFDVQDAYWKRINDR